MPVPVPVRKNPIRPKVKATATATGSAAVLVWAAGLVGVHTASVPPEVWVLATAAIGTVAAVVKNDGLRPAWERLVNGPVKRSRPPAD